MFSSFKAAPAPPGPVLGGGGFAGAVGMVSNIQLFRLLKRATFTQRDKKSEPNVQKSKRVMPTSQITEPRSESCLDKHSYQHVTARVCKKLVAIAKRVS